MPLVSNLCSWRESIMSNSHIVWTKPYSTLWCLSYRKLLHGPLRLHPTQGLAGLALIRATFSQISIKESVQIRFICQCQCSCQGTISGRCRNGRIPWPRLRAPVRLGWGGWPYAKKTISPGVQMIVQDSELINTSLSHKAANICKPWANISPYIPTSTTSTTKSPLAASHISSPIRPISPSHPLSWLSFQTVNPIENARSARLRRLPWIISQGHGLCK